VYGLVAPTGGELRVLGYPMGTHGKAVMMRLGVVPQELNLDPDLSVRENLLAWARFYGLDRRAREARAEELMKFADLEDKRDARMTELSGGMKRRLLIARALLNDPDVLILDEPTTGLDPQSRNVLWEKVRALKARGKTIVLTTHYMDEAEKLCDRLVIMERGRIITEGAPRDLIAREIGREVLELRLPESAHAPLLRGLGDRIRGHDALGDNLYLHTDNGEELLMEVKRLHAPVESAYYRRAGLEDVFLKLTGRKLTD